MCGIDLFCVFLQASSLQKQLELSESEISRLTDSAATAASRLSSCQAELSAAKQEAANCRQTADAAHQDVSQVSGFGGRDCPEHTIFSDWPVLTNQH